tara:strand:- start:117 stop:1238 length:1122 start_codon:yes stop_codon:yes gene_type:complete
MKAEGFKQLYFLEKYKGIISLDPTIVFQTEEFKDDVNQVRFYNGKTLLGHDNNHSGEILGERYWQFQKQKAYTLPLLGNFKLNTPTRVRVVLGKLEDPKDQDSEFSQVVEGSLDVIAQGRVKEGNVRVIIDLNKKGVFFQNKGYRDRALDGIENQILDANSYMEDPKYHIKNVIIHTPIEFSNDDLSSGYFSSAITKESSYYPGRGIILDNSDFDPGNYAVIGKNLARHLGIYVIKGMPQSRRDAFVAFNQQIGKMKKSKYPLTENAFYEIKNLIRLFSGDRVFLGGSDHLSESKYSEGVLMLTDPLSMGNKHFALFKDLYTIKSQHMKAFQAELEKLKGSPAYDTTKALMDLIPPYPGRVQRAINWVDKKLK